MDNIFMNSKNHKKSDPHRLLFNLADKINLKRSNRYVALLNLSIYYIWKDITIISHISTKKIKYQLQHGTKNLNYLMDSISDIQDYFEYILKNMGRRPFILQ